jgi:hypothetical protein
MPAPAIIPNQGGRGRLGDQPLQLLRQNLFHSLHLFVPAQRPKVRPQGQQVKVQLLGALIDALAY